MQSARKPGIQIAWKTVTYRSVVLMILAGLAILGIGTRLAFPDFSAGTVKTAGNIFDMHSPQITTGWLSSAR